MSVDRMNIVAVARREYLFRARTRTFKLTTALLVVVALGIALAPVILRAVFGEGEQTRIEVVVGQSNPAVDVAASVGATLNATADAPVIPGAGGGSEKPKYVVTSVDDEAAARARVLAGDTNGLLVVSRAAPGGDLAFDYVTKQTTTEQLPQVVLRAASQIAIQDRLATAGIPPADQGQVFAPPTFKVTAADPNAPPGSTEGPASEFASGFVLAIVLYLAIILYGQWIAYSVVEEKSSRVMEVILGAATPFELLSGKVVGVGALALTQYAIVFVPAAAALLLQDQIAALVLGGTAAPIAGVPGISLPLLLAFGLFLVLGFAVYAVLYAGAAALVSRTEDINQIVAPMTIISTIGYLIAVYSSTGILDPKSSLVVVLSYVPFFSPYLMLARMGAGLAGPLEVLAAIAILAVFVPMALWVAARLYAAGVLMYGQRPSLRVMLRVLRRGAR